LPKEILFVLSCRFSFNEVKLEFTKQIKKYKFELMFKQKRIRLFFERNGFAVSTRLAEVLGMKVKSVRLFFIYASFTTLIGGFLMYLTLAFWLKLKDMIYTKRSSVFDL